MINCNYNSQWRSTNSFTKLSLQFKDQLKILICLKKVKSWADDRYTTNLLHNSRMEKLQQQTLNKWHFWFDNFTRVKLMSLVFQNFINFQNTHSFEYINFISFSSFRSTFRRHWLILASDTGLSTKSVIEKLSGIDLFLCVCF